MRITNNMIIANMVRNIKNKYQTQLSTGKKISVPSDDPVVAARALKLRTDVSKIEQYKKNISDAQSWLSATDEALASIGKVLQTAREKIVQAANGTNTVDETKALADEIKQLRTQVIHLSNSTYSGRYIFSGFKTDQKVMIDDETDPNFGKFAIDVDSATRKEKIFYEVGVGDNININVTGGDLFNSQDTNAASNGLALSGETSSMISMFDQVIFHMEKDEKVDKDKYIQISACLDTIDAEIQNVLRVRADIGARQNRMDLTEDRIDNDFVNFTETMSLNEDIDIAETIMNLKNEENVYQASLAAGARIIQQSLVDFLH